MANQPLSGSGGYPPVPNPSGSTSGSGIVPRRSSYASVLSGSPNPYPQPPRSGALSNLLSQNPTSSNWPPFQSSRNHSRNPSRGLDMEGLVPSGVHHTSSSWGRGQQLQSLPHQFTIGPSYDLRQQHSHQFTPSYLKNSKYIERLWDSERARAIHQQENSGGMSHGGSLSTSSSSANLQKSAQVHHGVNISVTEREAPSLDNLVPPLPSRWSETDKAPGISVQNEGLEACFISASKAHSINEHDALTVRADNFMPPECGIYYFEITVHAKTKDGSMIGVGFCGPNTPLNRLPGWLADSWAYHGDDGNAFNCNALGKPYAEKFTTNDVIGCGLNFRTGICFFTKNGLYLGEAFNTLKGKGQLYPAVGMKKLGESVRANFGQKPFVFDIDGMIRREKQLLIRQINRSPADSLSPSLNETALIQALVAQYLAHDGYVETARIFATEVSREAKDLHIDGYDDFVPYQAEEDLDAVNRQRIRGAIIEGDVDKALKYTQAYYPKVLDRNPQIYFRLRCRKFIEMMKRCSDLLSTSELASNGTNGSTNGNTNDGYGAVFEQDMEIDDEGQAGGKDDDDDVYEDDPDDDVEGDDEVSMKDAKSSSEHSDATAKYHKLLQETLQYGQVLQLEFMDDGRSEVKKTLYETFHLLAYEDPKKSIVAHLLEPSQRIPVAEELNAAILVSLGKSSSACLERLCQQTEALVDRLAEEGGPGTLINMREDYLK